MGTLKVKCHIKEYNMRELLDPWIIRYVEVGMYSLTDQTRYVQSDRSLYQAYTLRGGRYVQSDRSLYQAYTLRGGRYVQSDRSLYQAYFCL